jgi:hypothetical protein
VSNLGRSSTATAPSRPPAPVPGWASCPLFLVTCLVPHVDRATDAWPGHWHPLYLLILAGYALALAVAAARLFRWNKAARP